LTGVIPVLIGWLAAGGTVTDTPCIFISAFMCLWQIPHFLFLLLHYEDDYMKTGFPLLTKKFSRKFLGNLIIAAFIAIALLMFGFIYFAIIYSITLQFIAILITALLLINIIRKVKDKKQKSYRYSMIMLNAYMLLIMLLILTDSLFVI
jgi:heme o synthase